MHATMTHASGRHTVEGIARVVRVEGRVAWLEPEQTTSCGHCASSSSCGAKGIGTVGARLEARRFPLDNDDALRVGERIVVGVDDRSLLKAAALAYGLPLAAALLAGGIADGVWADDPVSMAAAAGGLAVGLLAARIGARRLAAGGGLAPRYLRRATPGETCAS